MDTRCSSSAMIVSLSLWEFLKSTSLLQGAGKKGQLIAVIEIRNTSDQQDYLKLKLNLNFERRLQRQQELAKE